MKENGFTLIELLAVIVILAIIALIAIPIVLNIINNAKDSANKRSIELYCSAVKNSVMIRNLSDSIPSGTYLPGNNGHEYLLASSDVLNVEYDGNTVECNLIINENGTFKLNNCKVSGLLVDYGCNNGLIDTNDLDNLTKVYENGEIVYFDVTNGRKCSIDEYNTNVSNNSSYVSIKTGCMKFYTFNDSSESSTVDMILDHNTDNHVTWIKSKDYKAAGGEGSEYNTMGPLTALTQLKTDTESWIGVETPSNYINEYYGYTIDYSLYGSKARLITAQEVAKITGADIQLNWNELNVSSDWYLFDSKDQETLISGTSEYAWLFDYTSNCVNYGCNNSDSSTEGYWTVSAYVPANRAWRVTKMGYIGYGVVDYSGNCGIRPVITVEKSKLN